MKRKFRPRFIRRNNNSKKYFLSNFNLYILEIGLCEYLNQFYTTILKWAKHKHAERYLAGVSFAESSFFPIPVDVMLAPMVLAAPNRAWRLAAITTVNVGSRGAVWIHYWGLFF